MTRIDTAKKTNAFMILLFEKIYFTIQLVKWLETLFLTIK